MIRLAICLDFWRGGGDNFDYSLRMDFRVLILWVLLVLAGGCAFWWITVGIRVARDLPRIPRIKQGLDFALPVGEPQPRWRMCQELLFMQMVLVLGHFVSLTATQPLSE